MTNKLNLLLTLFLFGYFLNAQAAIDPNSLVKVTKENNPQCIEFYTYKGEAYCNTNPNNISSVIDPNIKTYEKQRLVFDDRPWQAVWGSKEMT